MFQVRGYITQQELSTYRRTQVIRARRQSDGARVVIKALTSHALAADKARLTQEYQIIQRLNEAQVSGIIRAIELTEIDNALVLILQDAEASTLKHALDQKFMSPSEFIPLGLKLAAIVEQVHANGIIHKDIKPENILYDPMSHALFLSDFGIASLLPRETQEINSPNLLEGTLLYISPEQTGRINRPVDYRSDFYSLGITFYEMLTGQVPFAGRDSVELVHCHIAKMPADLHTVRKNIPLFLSRVVMKLLAKNAEDRYQSGHGLRHDLTLCQTLLGQDDAAQSFVLGQKDVSSRLQISQKLYGRAADAGILQQTFQRVAHGACEMLLVGGYSGIGKSSLINEMQRAIVEQHGYYVAGKCDQFQRGVPYAALSRALSELVGQVLMRDEATVTLWRRKMQDALGPNVSLMVDVIPELAHLMGPQAQLTDLNPVERGARLRSTFVRFMGVFAQAEHPLVLFLDDLQWADAATLDLVKTLVTDSAARHLLLLGAYRDNEVTPSHPLILMLDEVKKSHAALGQVRLAPLSQPDVESFLCDTLIASQSQVAALAAVLHAKSGGNPFFLRQLLVLLHDEKWLAFDNTTSRWTWDVKRIEGVGITDNVVELLMAQLAKLPPRAQELLQTAACWGSQFHPDMLASAMGQRTDDVEKAARQAATEGMLVKSGEGYRFVHDRVQQAASHLLSDEARAQTHARIGMHLYQQMGQQPEQSIAIVSHFNRAGAHLQGQVPPLKIAQLNLQAAQRAQGASAYESALQYADAGIQQLDDSAWTQAYRLAFDLFFERAQCQYLCGQHDAAMASFDLVQKKSKARPDTAEVLLTKMTLLTSMGKHRECIAVGRDAMGLYQDALPGTDKEKQEGIGALSGEAMRLIAGRPLAQLVELAEMQDADARMKMRILMELVAPTYFTDITLYCWVGTKMLLTTMQFGLSVYAAYGFTISGIVNGAIFGQPQVGYQFGLLGVKAADKYGDPGYRSKSYMLMGLLINHWTHPLRDNIEFEREAMRLALQAGDLYFAAWAMVGLVKSLSNAGYPLNDVLDECQKYAAFTGSKVPELQAFPVVCGDFSEYLLGQQPRSDNAFVDAKYYASISGRELTIPQFTFCVKAMHLAYLFDDVDAGLSKLDDANKIAGFSAGQIATVDFHMAAIMLLCEKARETTGDAQAPWRARIKTHHDTLSIWATISPGNFSHQLMLANALIAQLDGQFDAAMEKFDQAIEQASAQQFVQYVAMSNEAAARFLLSAKKSRFAQGYLSAALIAYTRWGAVRKVRHFEAQHRSLLLGPALSAPQSAEHTITSQQHTEPTLSGHSSALDMQTMLKASQAISGEIVFENLLERIVVSMVENAGAETCALVLRDARKKRLVVEVAGGGVNRQATRPRTPLEESLGIARSVVQYVERTKREVVLADAAADRSFGQDAHIVLAQTKSVMCLPIEYHGQLRGVAYLENNLAKGAFTKDRLGVLGLIAAQAAIALENAQLYAGLEEKVAERTRELGEAQERLLRLEKEAVETQMAGGFAHEMRNALAVARYALETALPDPDDQSPAIVSMAVHVEELAGMVQALPQEHRAALEEGIEQARETEGRLQEILMTVMQGVSRGAKVTQQILAYAQVGHVTRGNESVNFAALVRGIAAEFQSEFSSRDIAMRLDVPEGTILQVKEEHAYSIVHNLVANARDAVCAQPSGVERRITVKSGVYQGRICLEVQDSGVGIADAAKSRIFQPFFTTKGTAGTGLGLGLSKKLVELYGGSIDFVSQENRGTDFKVMLPGAS